MKLLLDKQNNLVISISCKMVFNYLYMLSYYNITIMFERTIQIQNISFTIMETVHLNVMGSLCNINGEVLLFHVHSLFHMHCFIISKDCLA